MTIQFQCSECHKDLSTPDDGAGKQCKCTGCGALVLIPDPTVHLWPPGLGPKPKPAPAPAPAPPAPRRNGPPPLPDMPWVPGAKTAPKGPQAAPAPQAMPAPQATRAPQALPAVPAVAIPVAAPVAMPAIPTAAPVAGPVEIAPVELDPLASTEDEVDRAFLSYERAIEGHTIEKPAAPKPSRVPIVLPDDDVRDQGNGKPGDSGVFRRAWKAVRGEQDDDDA